MHSIMRNELDRFFHHLDASCVQQNIPEKKYEKRRNKKNCSEEFASKVSERISSYD